MEALQKIINENSFVINLKTFCEYYGIFLSFQVTNFIDLGDFKVKKLGKNTFNVKITLISKEKINNITYEYTSSNYLENNFEFTGDISKLDNLFDNYFIVFMGNILKFDALRKNYFDNIKTKII